MQNKSKKTLQFLTLAAVIAALYVAFTYLAALLGLASGAVQVRLSEALVALVIFTPAAIPGMTLGCLLANLLTGCLPPDVLFGTLATLLGALGGYALRRIPWLAPLPTVVANMVIVPLVLIYAYGLGDAYWFLLLTVGAGELISAQGLGTLLYLALRKHPRLFRH